MTFIADRVIGCIKCGKPCALVGDKIPEHGMCEWCHPMNVYTERAHILAALTTFMPSYLTVDTEGEIGFQTLLVIINSDHKQMTWYIADIDKWLFEHVPDYEGTFEYDGHSNLDKYHRLRRHNDI